MILAPAYYNENDSFAAQWLRNLISENLIAPGDVDERSIRDVEPADLAGYRQCHFFAGIGGWSLAARLAGWPDDRELWTGSAPCQPFSVAGKGKGADDDRHLWPDFFRLIAGRRPARVMGEQVAAAVGRNWFDGVCADLESVGYACGAAIVPACAVDAPHRRDRLWFVADRGGVMDHSERAGLERLAEHGDGSSGWAQQDRSIAATGSGGVLGDSDRITGGQGDSVARRGAGGSGAREVSGLVGADCVALADGSGTHDGLRVAGTRARFEPESRSGGVAVALADTGLQQRPNGGREARDDGQARGWFEGASSPAGCRGSAWAGAGWVIGHDGKARRVEPAIRLLANGVPGRVGRLRAYGNAIVPQVAAEVIGAYMDCMPRAST